MRFASPLVCRRRPRRRDGARIKPSLTDDEVHGSRAAIGCISPSRSTARPCRAPEGTDVLTVMPRTHRDIVDYLRREVRSSRDGASIALDSLPPGRSFDVGAIGREFGLPPSQAPRVDDVLIRLGIASDDHEGTVVIVGVCLASLRRVYETAGILYCAVLDQCLSDPDARSEFLEHTLAVLCMLGTSRALSSPVMPEWIAFLDSLEMRCRNPLLRTLIADVRLQMAFFIRPFVDDLGFDGSRHGLVILCDGIRDNDALIAVEGFQLVWRALDLEIDRLAGARGDRQRAVMSEARGFRGLRGRK